jgi:hypothetical protein
MRYSFLVCCGILILITTTACTHRWRQTEGVQVLPKAYPGAAFPTADEERLASRRIAIAFPSGWHWAMKRQYTMATRDGVFLQNILIERIHVDQAQPKIITSEIEHERSAWQWPVRNFPNLNKRFVEGMGSTEVADVMLDSRANNPSITDLQIREVAPLQFAGNHGFKAVFDFRLNAPDDRSIMLGGAMTKADVSGRKTPYRSLYYGFMRGQWFYGISYTAALRYYFDRDAAAFEAVIQSFQLVEE